MNSPTNDSNYITNSGKNYFVGSFASAARFILHSIGITYKELQIGDIQKGRPRINTQDKIFIDQRLSSWACVKQKLKESQALVYWIEN